jgi:rod shape-determining protein MreC
MPGFIIKYKKPIFILALFMGLFWLLTIQVRNGRFPVLERPVLAVSGILERIITWPFKTLVSIGNGYVFLVDTRQENVRLKEEIERMKIEKSIANELLLENERLREALEFRKTQPFSTVAVQVIGRDLSPASSTVTINKGSANGIRKDMAVITSDGVVGKIQTALSGTAKVILLTDPGSTVAVRVQRNREEGLLEGRLISCALKYVSFYSDIQEGDLLVTSGLDGIYPKGLPVATVTGVSKHEASTFQSVVARPAVSLSRLEEALVLIK